MILYITSYDNGELIGTREAAKDIKQLDRFVIPPYQTPVKHPHEALSDGEYWAFLDSNGNSVRDYNSGAWVKKQRQVKVTAYHKQTRQQKEFDDVSLIDDDHTTLKPKTQFDEWVSTAWVTNESNKYIADFNHVDDVRRSLYARICDPLISESKMKRLLGNQQESQELEVQAIAARKKIQKENPWPTRSD